MKELEIKEPIKMSLVQYQCPGCEKKFYINKEDYDELTEKVDCPFCNICGVPFVRIFDIEIKKIFEKD